MKRKDLENILKVNKWAPKEYYNMVKKNFIHNLKSALNENSLLCYRYALEELEIMYKLNKYYDIG